MNDDPKLRKKLKNWMRGVELFSREGDVKPNKCKITKEKCEENAAS